jgi:DNA polymerase I
MRFHTHGQVVIVSDDKDMYQLIGDGVKVYSSRHDKLMGEAETVERFGVPPVRIVDYLALVGDASDNIPGVSGVGEVTAKSLINTYGALEDIVAHASELKGKLKDKIEAGVKDAFLSKQLATLDIKIPFECTLSDIKAVPPDTKKLFDLFSELEFRRLADEFSVDQLSFDVPVAKPLEMRLSQDNADTFVRRALEGKKCSLLFDIERDEHHVQHLNKVYGALEGDVFCFEMTDLDALKEVLQAPDVLKIVYGLKEALKIIRRDKITPCGAFFDVELAGYLLMSGRGAFDINALSWKFLDRGIADDQKEVQEAATLFALHEPLLKELNANDVLSVFNDMETPLADVLALMEMEGVRLDVDVLDVLAKKCAISIDALTSKIYAAAGGEFNINSPKQMGVVLFEKLGLKAGRKTKTGYSTDEETLIRLASSHEVPSMILEYRQVSKLKSTYIDALPRLVSAHSGRIHCSFDQTGTETGRLSSNHPNLQNIPIRSEMGREIRKAFVAVTKERMLLSADYSQIELRVLAHLADEPNLKKAFDANEDIHRWTAGLMFDIPPAQVDEKMRSNAKRINFGIIYGMSAFGLAKDLGVSQKEAQGFIDLYFARFPGIRKFMDQEIEGARSKGFVETLFHRRRYLPDITSKNPMIRQFAERQAVNTPVQGTAADMIKLAMVHLANVLKKEAFDAHMIITVHDELVFDVSKADLQRLALCVKDVMAHVCAFSVPVDVTLKAGKNWAEMEKI